MHPRAASGLGWKDARAFESLSSRRAMMDGAAPGPSTSELAEWCVRWLDAAPARLLWSRHHLSHVFGIELVDAREVVGKVRTDTPRITATIEVQRSLADAGFPAPSSL